MDRANGLDAGRVSAEARFDVAFADDMAVYVAEKCREFGVKKLRLDAGEETDSGSCAISIEVEMQTPPEAVV
jgi:hypothetical protein